MRFELTDKYIAEIKKQIQKGFNWVAKNGDIEDLGMVFTENEPKLVKDTWYAVEGKFCYHLCGGIFNDFIEFENSPIYLPSLVKEEE